MRCDCHVHIVGPPDAYPQVANRTYVAGIASLDTLVRLGRARGIGRFVIVQPSFYGTDNTMLLESLDRLGGSGRGVAVVDPQRVNEATLADLARRGVRGLRVNLYSTLAGRELPLERVLGAHAEIAKKQGWHVELIAPAALLARHAPLIAGAGVPVVVDHYGLYGRATPTSEAGRALLDLLRAPNIWLKLSAPYRVSDDPLNIRPDAAWLAAFLDVAPDRCVWGSDWPYTPPHELHKGDAAPLPYRAIDYTAMVDAFVDALGSAAMADRILRDNPARLYEFA